MPAKTLSANPIVVTSADTFTTTTDKVRITGIYWDPGTSAANDDVVAVAHADGTLIWSATLDTTDLGERSLHLAGFIQANGLAITPPTHGTLYVYHADSYA